MREHQPPAGESGRDRDTSGRADPHLSTGMPSTGASPSSQEIDRGTDSDRESGASSVGSSMDRTGARVREGAEELRTKGREALREVEHTARDQVERRSAEMAEEMESVVQAMRTAADELEEDGRTSMARYTRRAAEQMERMTRYLRDHDAPSMLHDVEDVARRSPGTFLGSSFAAGLALGRFLRSSRPSPDQGRTRALDRESFGTSGFPGTEAGPGAFDTDRQLTPPGGGSHGTAY